MQSDELDFVAFGRRLARQAAAQIAFHQLDIFRRNEIGQRLADDVRGGNAQQGQETRIGEQDVFAVNQHGVVHRLDQALKELFAVLQTRAALVEIFSSSLTAAPSCPSARLPLSRCAPRRPLARELQNLLGKLADGAFLAALADEEHTHTHR